VGSRPTRRWPVTWQYPQPCPCPVCGATPEVPLVDGNIYRLPTPGALVLAQCDRMKRGDPSLPWVCLSCGRFGWDKSPCVAG
jgi:hypothetical protein